jgi:hypothetical protein
MLIFISLKKAELLLKTAIDICIRKLLSELDLTIDYLRKSLILGGLKKIGRNLAKEMGFLKQELDAIGNWKQKLVVKEHYKDFKMPKSMLDVILRI